MQQYYIFHAKDVVVGSNPTVLHIFKICVVKGNTVSFVNLRSGFESWYFVRHIQQNESINETFL